MVKIGAAVGQEYILELLIEIHAHLYASNLVFERRLRCGNRVAAKSRILACKQTDRVSELPLFLQILSHDQVFIDGTASSTGITPYLQRCTEQYE
jgi:hypothetical protein